MSSGGRGRGYTGRHHSRARPGDCTEEDAARTLAELSPRATDRESRDKDKSQETAMPRERERKTSHQELRERESKISHQELRERESKISNQEPRELEPETSDLLDNISSEDDSVLKELLNIDEQFQPLLVLLEQFLPSEDGIQFNRKLRNFETTITNMCPDEIRLQAAFASFRAAALRNPVTARKLAGVGASFTRQQRQQLLRTTLLNVIMQGTFSKLDILERANPVFLINAANLMGDYFSEARLCNGNKVHILASPLLQYMKALLASDDVRAHRSLATQLMQNGRELLAVQQTETEELTIKIRLRLLTPPPCGIVWLLLSSDMALNKFLPLPNCLQQFYASNLKLTSDSDYSEVSYGSWKKSPEEKSDESQNLSHNISNISLMDEDGSSRPRLRPILGAGAGLLKQNLAQDFDWTQKTTLSKRYDLNSWRQEGEKEEPVFDPSVLPPPLVPPNLPRNFSEYPPPNFNYKEQYNNYLQQGDGHYIQQYNYDVFQGPEESEFSELALSERTFPELPMPDRTFPETIQTYPECFQEDVPERATIADFENCDRTIAPDNDKVTDKVNNEIQTSSRKPLENWRRDKTDGKEDPKTWTRQKSKDNVSDDDKERRIKNPARANRRNSDEKSPTRRHVSDVPRNHKYWDHDDRCDKDY